MALQIVHAAVSPLGDPIDEYVAALKRRGGGHPTGDEAERLRLLTEGLLQADSAGQAHVRLTVGEMALKLNSLVTR